MADNSNLIADALLQTDEALYNSIDAENSFLSVTNIRGARVNLYRRYERGDHRANITDQMRAMLRLVPDDAQLSDFNDNYMQIIIDKMAGRVKVTEVSSKSGTDTWLSDLLERNQFAAAQGMWWRGACRDGDSYVMIDPKTLRWSSEPAYDGFSGVVAIFDTLTRKPKWACKIWSESDVRYTASEEEEAVQEITTIMHLVVYQPHQISWWTGTPYGTEVVADPESAAANRGGLASEENVMAWPPEIGSLPLVHFANQQDSYTCYGGSELRPAIPLQDVLNRTLHSMVMASELSAFRIIYSIGLSLNVDGIAPGAVLNLTLKDKDGKVITDFTPEQVQFLQAAKIGQLEGSNLAQYTSQIDQIVRQISQATQTPIYGVTADGNLSGEALKQLEIGLVGKVRRFQEQNTDAVKQLIQLTAAIQNSLDTGQGQAPKLGDISVSWASAELLDTNAQITSLMLIREKGDGLWADDFYRVKVGALLGMSQSQIKEESAAAKAETEETFNRLTARGTGAVPLEGQPGFGREAEGAVQ